ncbi:MAG: ribosome biogenesis GTPase YlqF [Candidatus Sericytochromatia bacterium]
MSSLINWYPGHIAKAQNTLKEQLKLIDFVLELVDARLPSSGRFDVTNTLLRDKPRILVVTKSDMADKERVQAWIQYYRNQGHTVVAINAQTGQGMPGLQKAMQLEHDKVKAKMVARGRLPRASRVMVVGQPNVGKSSLINKLAKKRTVDVGNKPGVTKGVRWIRLGATLELMDTPGIIPAKLDNQELALKLALVGSVSTEAYDPIIVAPAALKVLEKYAPETLQRFKDDLTLEGIGKKRGYLLPGGEINLERTSRSLMNDIRDGVLGPMTLDYAPMEVIEEITEPQGIEGAEVGVYPRPSRD